MTDLAKHFTLIFFVCFLATPAFSQGQSSPPVGGGNGSSTDKAVPLPAAKHGQPIFSFSGGQRVTTQKTSAPGLHDYSVRGESGAGTGVVEVGSSGSIKSTGINEIMPGSTPSKNAGVMEIGNGKSRNFSTPANLISPSGGGKLLGTSALTGSTGKGGAAALKNKNKPSTTVVQTLGPDGKMQYKEVPFVGELESNKRAPNITDVKDGEGKVKEYGWKKNH